MTPKPTGFATASNVASTNSTLSAHRNPANGPLQPSRRVAPGAGLSSGLVGLGAKYWELTATLGVKSPTLERLPMRCPFCDRPIDRNNAWKGTADRFYCSEFCADSECIPSRQQSLKERFGRQYLARLERLVALRQQQGESFLSRPRNLSTPHRAFSFLTQ
jgi:hypothetical protein